MHRFEADCVCVFFCVGDIRSFFLLLACDSRFSRIAGRGDSMGVRMKYILSWLVPLSGPVL